MINYFKKPEIRELEKIFGGFIRYTQIQKKGKITMCISIGEQNTELFEERMHLFQEIAKEEGFLLKKITSHQNKQQYLFSKEQLNNDKFK